MVFCGEPTSSFIAEQLYCLCFGARPRWPLAPSGTPSTERRPAQGARQSHASTRATHRGVFTGRDPFIRVSATASGFRTEATRFGDPGKTARGPGGSAQRTCWDGGVHYGVLPAGADRLSSHDVCTTTDLGGTPD